MAPLPTLMEPGPSVASTEHTDPRSIAFGAAHLPGGVPMPRLDVPGPFMRTVRDPAWSLSALSGVDPSGPVMVEVPLVLNNSTFTAAPALSGWRVGFADRYLDEVRSTPIMHSSAFLHALETLRTAGAELVPVPAQQPDAAAHFSLHTLNEIDQRVTEHRLDVLVSEGQSAAFHAACRSGYPSLCEPMAAGGQLWFYGARWARDALAALVQGYRLTAVSQGETTRCVD